MIEAAAALLRASCPSCVGMRAFDVDRLRNLVYHDARGIVRDDSLRQR